MNTYFKFAKYFMNPLMIPAGIGIPNARSMTRIDSIPANSRAARITRVLNNNLRGVSDVTRVARYYGPT